MAKPNDPYVDPDTGVLINRLGITDGSELALAETRLMMPRYKAFIANPLPGKFDQNHLQSIHQHLFEPLYYVTGEHDPAFAGAIRIIGIVKDDDDVNYPHPDHPIEPLQMRMDYAFGELKKDILQSAKPKQLKNKLAAHLAEFWECLPFRDGNTRTNFLFGFALAKSLGIDYNLKASAIKEYRVAIREYARPDGDKSVFKAVISELLQPTRTIAVEVIPETISEIGENQPIDPKQLSQAQHNLDSEVAKGLDALQRKHDKALLPLQQALEEAKQQLDDHGKRQPPTNSRTANNAVLAQWNKVQRSLKQNYGHALRAVNNTENRYRAGKGERLYLAQKRANDQLPAEAKLVALHADREQAKHLLSRWRSLESELNTVAKDKGSPEKAEFAIRESLDRVFQQIALSPNVQAALPANRRSMLSDKTTENAKRIGQTRALSRGRGITR